MSKIVVTMKIFPEDVIISIEEIKEDIRKALPESVTLYKIEEEPIAFGLIALIAHIVMSEKDTDEFNKVEKAIRSVKGVSEIEILLIRRV